MSTTQPDATNALIVADLSKKEAESWKRTSAAGVTFMLGSLADQSGVATVLVVTNAGAVPRNAAWVRLEKRFDPPLNLKDHQALGVELEGDGSGLVVAVRLESPHHIAYGAIADRYVPLDFTGRRSFTLVETESSRWSDFVWNDSKGHYNVYRETINFGVVDSVSIWLQNLPSGRETKVRLGPICAVLMRPVPVKNPKVTVAGNTITFPVELVSGSWMECNGPEDCTAYGPKGELLGKVTPRGEWPTLGTGVTSVKFDCERKEGPAPRARVTVFSQGAEL
jgi:hypothetical protein